MLRRPMAELGFFFVDRGHHPRHDAAPDLPRRLADHVDEFRFGVVGHEEPPRATRMPSGASKFAPNCLTTSFADLRKKGRLTYRHSLISTKCPAMAAAAAIAGETRWVRPLKP